MFEESALRRKIKGQQRIFGRKNEEITKRSVKRRNEIFREFCSQNINHDNTGTRAVYSVGLRSFACWDCGFESRRGHGCLRENVL
jgi:G:T-mismatch repair DNA endonuclease (very short patch repair protein)